MSRKKYFHSHTWAHKIRKNPYMQEMKRETSIKGRSHHLIWWWFKKVFHPPRGAQTWDHMHPKIAMNVTQHKIIILLKTVWLFFFKLHGSVLQCELCRMLDMPGKGLSIGVHINATNDEQLALGGAWDGDPESTRVWDSQTRVTLSPSRGLRECLVILASLQSWRWEN